MKSTIVREFGGFDDKSVDFSIDPDMYKKLGIKKAKKGDENIYDMEKVVRFQMEKDIEKIRKVKGPYQQRAERYNEIRKNDQFYKKIAIAPELGKSGRFRDVVPLTTEMSWKATSQPYGIIAHKRYLEYLANLPKGPTAEEIRERLQREKDAKLWNDLRTGKLEPTKKELRAREIADLLKQAEQKTANEVEGYHEKLKAAKKKEKMDAGRFEELRKLPTQREQKDSLHQWHKGVHYPYNFNKGMPYVVYCEDQKAGTGVIREAVSMETMTPEVFYSSERFMEGNRTNEADYLRYMNQQNIRKAEQYLKKRRKLMQLELKRKREEEEQRKRNRRRSFQLTGNIADHVILAKVKTMQAKKERVLAYMADTVDAEELKRRRLEKEQLEAEGKLEAKEEDEDSISSDSESDLIVMDRPVKKKKKKGKERQKGKTFKTMRRSGAIMDSSTLENLQDTPVFSQQKRKGIEFSALEKVSSPSKNCEIMEPNLDDNPGVAVENKNESRLEISELQENEVKKKKQKRKQSITPTITPSIGENSDSSKTTNSSQVDAKATDIVKGSFKSEPIEEVEVENSRKGKKKAPLKPRVGRRKNSFVVAPYDAVLEEESDESSENDAETIRRKRGGCFRAVVMMYEDPEKAMHRWWKRWRRTKRAVGRRAARTYHAIRHRRTNKEVAQDRLKELAEQAESREFQAQLLGLAPEEIPQEEFVEEAKRKTRTLKKEIAHLEMVADDADAERKLALLKKRLATHEKLVSERDERFLSASKQSAQIREFLEESKQVISDEPDPLHRQTASFFKRSWQAMGGVFNMFKEANAADFVAAEMEQRKSGREQQHFLPKFDEAENRRIVQQLEDARTAELEKKNYWNNIYSRWTGFEYVDAKAIVYTADDLVLASRAGNYKEVLEILSSDFSVGPNELNADGYTATFAALQMILKKEVLESEGDLSHLFTSPWERIQMRIHKFFFPNKAKESVAMLDLVLHLLLNKGGDVDFLRIEGGADGTGIIHLAAQLGANEMIQWLLDKGTSVDLRSAVFQKNAMMEAVEYDQLDTVMFLLKNSDAMVGVQKQHVDSRGWTCLHYAAVHARLEIAHVLLICGAKPNVRNANGRLPSEEAKAHGRQEVMTDIMQFKADIVEHVTRIDCLSLKNTSSARHNIEKFSAQEEEERKLRLQYLQQFGTNTLETSQEPQLENEVTEEKIHYDELQPTDVLHINTHIEEGEPVGLREGPSTNGDSVASSSSPEKLQISVMETAQKVENALQRQQTHGRQALLPLGPRKTGNGESNKHLYREQRKPSRQKVSFALEAK